MAIIAKVKHPETGIDMYFEWSTVADGPITPGMKLEDFKRYYYAEYGMHKMIELQERLDRVDQHGTSSPKYYDDIDDLLNSHYDKWSHKDIINQILGL